MSFAKKKIRKYFKSSADRYAFILIYLDTVERNRMLGVTLNHYSNKELADKWYKKIKSTLEKSETLSDEDKSKALDRLDLMYIRMREK